MTYPFRQGLDYGHRPATLGLSFHMTEGNGGIGDVAFLAQRPGESRQEWASRVNGVSAHAVLTSDGTVYQMLKWDRACGNLNPDDRAAEYGYYGHHHLVDVLGDWWQNPNAATLSMEIGGKRAQGPTAAQRDAAIAWGLEMRELFPSIRGATGHHDQSPKPCPGLKANMKAIFDGVGGHGLWKEPTVRKVTMTGEPGSITIIPNPSNRYLKLDDDTLHEYAFTEKDLAIPCDLDPPLGAHKEGYLVGNLLAFIPEANATFTPTPPADCSVQDAKLAAVKEIVK